VGLGVGRQILIAHRVGAGKLEEADAQFHRALSYAIAGSGALGVVLALCRGPLLALLTHDSEIVRLASPLFAIGVLVEMARAANIVTGGALRSTGDAGYAAVVAPTLMWCVGVPAAFAFGSSSLGLTGVWLSMALDEGLRGFVSYRRWRSGRWRTTSQLAPAILPEVSG
jgi:Na+-driven multidrug efflux pump